MKLCEGKKYYLRENKTGREDVGCMFCYAFGKDALHFHFDVKDDDVISPYRNDNDDIWHGDAVEVFISPDGDLTRYKEIEVSPFGVRFYGEIIYADGQMSRLKKTEPEYDAEAVRTEYGYAVTIRLPFKAMKGFDRLKMKLNAFRLDKKENGGQELYALNPTFCNSFHRPKYFLSEGVLE